MDQVLALMTWRDAGAIEFVRSVLPDAAIPLFVAITYLGDPQLLIGLVVVGYLLGERRTWVYLLAVALGGMALTVALKWTFALPRPPVALHATPVDGYGFPSGHAVAATVVWGSLARTLTVSTQRRRYAFAGVLVGLIALSRVVLGVHYAEDVLVGVAVGLAYLAAIGVLAPEDPDRAFPLAAVVALLAAVASRGSVDGMTLLGAAVGAGATWRLVDVPDSWPDATRSVIVFSIVIALGVVSLALQRYPLPPAAVLLGFVGVFASLVALPAVVRAVT